MLGPVPNRSQAERQLRRHLLSVFDGKCLSRPESFPSRKAIETPSHVRDQGLLDGVVPNRSQAERQLIPSLMGEGPFNILQNNPNENRSHNARAGTIPLFSCSSLNPGRKDSSEDRLTRFEAPLPTVIFSADQIFTNISSMRPFGTGPILWLRQEARIRRPSVDRHSGQDRRNDSTASDFSQRTKQTQINNHSTGTLPCLNSSLESFMSEPRPES